MKFGRGGEELLVPRIRNVLTWEKEAYITRPFLNNAIVDLMAYEAMLVVPSNEVIEKVIGRRSVLPNVDAP